MYKKEKTEIRSIILYKLKDFPLWTQTNTETNTYTHSNRQTNNNFFKHQVKR